MLIFPALRVGAEDQIVMTNGSTVNGEIVSVSGGSVFVKIHTPSGGVGQIPARLSDIKSVTMTSPIDLAKLKDAAPAAVVTSLEPVVQKFAGLPADWVVDAMAQLATAYDASNQADKASAIYTQINQLYPNSAYQNLAVAGQARQLLEQGKVDDALAMLQPLIDKANQNLAPSAQEGRLYASAFLVYGDALQAQKKPQLALEAYLTVTTMFYQNANLADQARQDVVKLRSDNPGVGID